jgi:hypothetical protein
VRVDLEGASVELLDPKQPRTFNGRTGNYLFDPANFSRTRLEALNDGRIPAPDERTYGTLGRNVVRAPGFFTTDLALVKSFNIWRERVKMDLRGEFFNLFNNVNFALPTPAITSGTFGQFGSTFDQRIGQLAVRVTF